MPLSRIVLNNKNIIWYKAFSLRKCYHKFRIRASLLGFSGFLGSMTVEASLIMPVFIYFMLSLLYIFQILDLQTQVIINLHQEGNQISRQAYGDRQHYHDGLVIMEESYRVKPFLLWMDSEDLEFTYQYYGHAWVGYDYNRYENNQYLVEYIYVTETGSVYHRRADCTYLELSVSSVDRSEIPSMRNQGGGRYYKCEICGDGEETLYYLTDHGNRYHSNPICPGLKRTVFKIPMEEAISQGKRGCAKCG